MKTRILLKRFYWRAWTHSNCVLDNFWTVFINFCLFFYSLCAFNCKSHKTASTPWGENYKSEIKGQQMHNRQNIHWRFLISLFHWYFHIMQIHFKVYDIWIHSLFAVAIQYFCHFIVFVNINPQICMVLAILKHTCPFSQQALRFLACWLFSFSPVLLFSASSWNHMEWDTFYFAAQFWKSWVAWAIIELQDQLFFFTVIRDRLQRHSNS